jgi:multiple sugar transport system substrate-binding protein
MTKRLAAVLGLLVLAVVLVASSAQAGHKTQKAANVAIAGWSAGPDEDTLVQQMVDRFNATHSTIHVKWTVINGDYGAAMTARFAAHNPPDVFYVDSSVVGSWEKQHVLQSLNSFVKKSHFKTKPFYPKLLAAFKHGKTIYGFPKDWGPLAMETNNAMLGSAGVKPPKTWAQLKSAAKTIKNKTSSKHPICLSADWARMGAFMYQNKGSISKHLTSQANVQAVKYYVGLLHSGLGYTPPSGSWCGQELGQGNAAIVFEGPWILPYMKQVYPDTHYGVHVLPKGKTRGNLAFTVSWSLAKDSKNKAAAWKVLSWLVGKPGEKVWMSKGLSLSPRTDVKTIGGRKPFLSAGPYSHGWGFGNPNFQKANGVMNNDLSAVIDNKMSIPAMLSDVAKALKGQ